MDTEKIKKLTPYEDINDLLLFWSKEVSGILGDKIIGLYLTGSLTYDDFVPERSDIDLLAVVKNPLSPKDIEAVKQLHLDIEKRYPKWKERIECSYLPAESLHDILPPQAPRPYIGGGIFYPEAPYGNEWIINQYFLYKYGVPVEGPDFKTLINPVDIKDVQQASARDLFQEWEPKINDPEWLQNSHYQSYLVLNLCRILYTVVYGDAGSKKVSTAWVKAAYPEWKNLIETAESWQYGTEMNDKEKAIGFIKFVISEIKEKNL